jgi:L,D-transpeptidase catalytic domain
MQMNRRSFVVTALAGLGVSTIPFSSAIAAPDKTALRPKLMEKAIAALAKHRANIAHADIIAIADFGVASAKARFHLVDLVSGQTTSMLVAHGKGSDPAHTGWLQSFSNLPGSNSSSQGSYLTDQFYNGKHGRSRRLLGLDPQNNLALDRAIVIHAADYVSDDMVKNYNKIGRSQGCFAVPEINIAQVLDRLGPGRLLFADKA